MCIIQAWKFQCFQGWLVIVVFFLRKRKEGGMSRFTWLFPEISIIVLPVHFRALTPVLYWLVFLGSILAPNLISPAASNPLNRFHHMIKLITQFSKFNSLFPGFNSIVCSRKSLNVSNSIALPAWHPSEIDKNRSHHSTNLFISLYFFMNLFGIIKIFFTVFFVPLFVTCLK